MASARKGSIVDESTVGVTSVFTRHGSHAVLEEGAGADETTLGALGYKQEFKRCVTHPFRTKPQADVLIETSPSGNHFRFPFLCWVCCHLSRQPSATAWVTQAQVAPYGDGSSLQPSSNPRLSPWLSCARACRPLEASTTHPLCLRPKDGDHLLLGLWAGPISVDSLPVHALSTMRWPPC